MRHARFFDFLYDLVPDWLGRLVGVLLLLSLLVLGYRFVRAFQAEQRAENARLRQANAERLRKK